MIDMTATNTELMDNAWIETYSGRPFHVFKPRLDEIFVEDIAHALSNTCRFTGHCKRFYSVAQHCCLVAAQLTEFAPEGLMHDGTEAYMSDLSSPLKACISGYRIIEHILEEKVAQRFNLRYPWPIEVKEADTRMLLTERRDLLTASGLEWSVPGRPYDFQIEPWSPEEAEERFLITFIDLKIQTIST